MLHALVDAQSWSKQSWEDLIEELLTLGRADVALARLAEGHIDALRILDQAGCTPEPDALYGVWASRSQQTGVRARRTDSGGLELTGTLSFASGAGLLDRALIPVWPTEDTHLLVDLAVADLPVDTTGWRTAAMAATRTHRVMIENLLVEPAEQVGATTSTCPGRASSRAGSAWRPAGWVAPRGSPTCCTGGTRSPARCSSSGSAASGPT